MKDESSSSDEDHRSSNQMSGSCQSEPIINSGNICYKKTLRLTSDQLVCFSQIVCTCREIPANNKMQTSWLTAAVKLCSDMLCITLWWSTVSALCVVYVRKWTMREKFQPSLFQSVCVYRPVCSWRRGLMMWCSAWPLSIRAPVVAMAPSTCGAGMTR